MSCKACDFFIVSAQLMKTKSTSQLRLVEIKSMAIKTFGTLSKAEHWLNNITCLYTIFSFTRVQQESQKRGDALTSPLKC